MAITRAENQVTWSSSNSTSVSSGSNATSDAVTLDDTCVKAAIHCKADNGGTPASGDTMDFYWAASCGDPDGASTAEYPTDPDNMLYLCTLDTNDTDGDSKIVALPAVPTDGKVYVVNNASSNSITASATIEEMRAA